MNSKMFLLWIVLTQAIVVAAQTNDDLYYRPSKKTEDFRAEKTIDHYTNTDKPYEEPPFYTSENGQSDATASAGNHVTDNTNDNAQQRQGISTSAYDDGYGNTYVTNNYYGDYYNNDYPSYTARINRFYRPAIGWGYYSCYFDPFWCDPFWDPWWGWNSWCCQPGFSVSIGWGWPWWYGRWGWNWGWNWWNPYWNGYFHGYWNGFYDGLYGNYWNSNWWAGINSNPNSIYYGPRRMAAPVNDNNGTTANAGVVNTPRVIKSELPTGNDNNRAITINRYTRDVKPVQSYESSRTPESYSINKNRSDLRSTNSDNPIVNQSGKTGIRIPNNSPNYTPPRTNRFENNITTEPDIRNRRGTTGIRMYEYNRPENRDPHAISPAHPGNQHNRGVRNSYRNQPSFKHEHSLPHGIRNNHHTAPIRNQGPSISAPSRVGSGALSPASVSPGNLGRGGRVMH